MRASRIDSAKTRPTRRSRGPWLAALLIVALGAGLPGAARANALDDAKAAGQLGERYDGYLGVVQDGAPASIQALAKDINGKRKVHYAGIAAQEGTQVEAVAAIAGAKLIKGAPSGQYVMPSPDSGWKRVP